ncbi:MAG: methyltransferase domain-containing protein, partial [Ignavibacteriaceae bacterium]|nr:methyltransferase domain-containing protein [Ignavibacteriaceae bacterium]
MQFSVDTPEFWDDQYKNNKANWDMKSTTPAFIELLKNTIVFGEDKGDILVVGSGKGYDAVEAAKNGFSVTAIDISKKAAEYTKQTAEKENVDLKILVNDIFLLPEEYNNKYDFIYDYTTY